MQPLISEFSYGYVLTQELATGILGGITGAPIFPSLRDEGQPGGGYDVELPRVGFPLYLQFKLSDYLSRTSANEWDVFMAPYYRMHLRPLRHSDQHNLLLDLERAGNEVYYAAPEFHTQPELNDAYFKREVFLRSRLFRPLAIGPLPDDDAHYVAFRARAQAYRFSAEGLQIESSSGEELRSRIKHLASLEQKNLDGKFLESACSSLLSIIEGHTSCKESAHTLEKELKREKRSRDAQAAYLSYLSWVFFGTQLILIGPSSSPQRA